MATWSISVSSMVLSVARSAARHPAEQGDLVLADLLTERGIVDAEPVGGRQAADAELALGLVVVDRQRGVPHALEVVGGRQDGLDLALGQELVGVPRLLV